MPGAMAMALSMVTLFAKPTAIATTMVLALRTAMSRKKVMRPLPRKGMKMRVVLLRLAMLLISA